MIEHKSISSIPIRYMYNFLKVFVGVIFSQLKKLIVAPVNTPLFLGPFKIHMLLIGDIGCFLLDSMEGDILGAAIRGNERWTCGLLRRKSGFENSSRPVSNRA